jgi:hypothetical protein
VCLAVAIEHYLLGACEVSHEAVKSAKKDYNHYFAATAQILIARVFKNPESTVSLKMVHLTASFSKCDCVTEA